MHLDLRLGVVRKAPDDGVLRGRVGAKCWLCQLCLLSLLSLVLLVVVIVSFAQMNLVQLLVFLLLGCLGAVVLRTWFYPLAWMGLDLSLPAAFDLGAEGIEIASWRQHLQRRFVSRAALRDLRVYRAAVDFSADSCYAEPEPLAEAQMATLALELPRVADAARECGRSLLLCCSASRTSPGVACVFLAAKVVNEDGDEEIVQLSRCIWRMRQVERLCKLAQEARSRSGIQEALVPEATVVGADAGKAVGGAAVPAGQAEAKKGGGGSRGGSPTSANTRSPGGSTQGWTTV